MTPGDRGVVGGAAACRLPEADGVRADALPSFAVHIGPRFIAVWVFSLLGLRAREPGERLAVSLRSQLSMIAPLLVRDN